MIDNVTLVNDCIPPVTLLKSNGRPFEYRAVIYSPKYRNGQIIRYEAQLKNLRLFIYDEKMCLFNSLHKYWHNNNYNDFNLSEIKEAIESLNNETGTDWNQAVIKKIEFGCNIKANAGIIVGGLLSYKGKDYLPMQRGGKRYGAVCEFADYKIKGYDKTFEVKQTTALGLSYPLFRWEVSFNRFRVIEKITCSQVKVKQLLKPEILQMIAKDAVLKYENTIKMQHLNLYKLTTHEKRVLAEMLIPQIREDLKNHNKETFKRDQRIYRRLMANKSICISDDTKGLIEQKFKALIEDTKSWVSP